MKKLYIFARNHMDPSWRRCFTDHFTYKGDVIHPYADIEESLIRQGIEFAERYGYKYAIEQSISVKRFLERNPDLAERFARLVREGKIELLGGGECVIDYNMVCGESIYRTHYYSIQYYERTFGVKPRYADLPDTFGLSAQLPQILRQFGYEALTQYDRVFQGHKPYWRGLNGDLILIEPASGIADQLYGNFYKYTACPACHGDGCPVCGGSGIDYSYNFSCHDREGEWLNKPFTPENPSSLTKTLDGYLAQFAQEGKEECAIYVQSEETLHDPRFPQYLQEVAAKHGFAVEFLTHAEVVEHFAGAYLEALRRGQVDESLVDERSEGNPMATGCLVSRIEIKKKNRMLEQLLLAAEKAAALYLPGEQFPRGKLERLWNLMAFIQFHDCITASHTDASYQELLRLCRDVHLGATQIYREALAALERRIAVPERPGLTPMLLFNPLNAPVTGLPLTAVLRDRERFEGVEIFDAAGRKLPVVSQRLTENAWDWAVEAQFLGDLPALGYGVFYWRPAKPALAAPGERDFIENEFYRVDAYSVFDKELGHNVLCDRPGTLTLSRDKGHAWGRLEPESNVVRLQDSEYRTEQGEGFARIVRRGGYANPEYGVRALTWTQTITLYRGVKRIDYCTELDWEGQDCRIAADFPLSIDPGPEALYEIPFGILARPHGIHSSDQLGIEDEWPALNWFACHDQARNCSVVLMNRGLPGSRVKDGHMQLSLLRSPTVLEFANEGAVDHGRHVSEFAVTTCPGAPEAADPVFAGLRYNNAVGCVPATAKAGDLPPTASSLANEATNVVIPAIKRDAAGTLVLRMAEAYGHACHDALPGRMAETDPLEEAERPAESLAFAPFEIKTVKLR